MKTKILKRMMGVALAAVMLLSAGCGKKFDASGYVKACLDLSTRGETAKYMELTGRTEEQAIADYESGTDEFLSAFESLGLSEDLQGQYATLMEDLLKKTKYTVGEAKKGDAKDSFVVPVEVEPITGVFEGMTEELQEEATVYMTELMTSGADVTEEEVMEKVFSIMYDILADRVANAAYGEKQTIEVSVELMGDVYGIPEDELTGLTDAMIDLTGLE